MIIRDYSTFTPQETYVDGCFNPENGSYIINGTEGSSRFGNILTAYGTDYLIGLSPDGIGCSIFDKTPITSPDGLGKVWYIKDLETGETWSPVLIPLCKEYDEYQASYLPGEVSIYTLRKKIACNLTISAVPGESCEKWTVKISNSSAKERVLAFVCYMDAFFESDIEANYFDSENMVTMSKTASTSKKSKRKCIFLSSSLKPVVYLIPKTCFGGEGDSKILLETNNLCANAEDPLLSFSVKLDIPLEGSAEVSLFFGSARSHGDAVNIVNRAKSEKYNHQDWKRITSGRQVSTPDKLFDALANIWLPYEAYISARKDTSPSAELNPQNITDKIRSIESISNAIPEDARVEILDFASKFDFDGNFEVSDISIVKANPIEALYLITAVSKYILESNDKYILDELVNNSHGRNHTLLEHCKKTIELSIDECKKVPSQNNINRLKSAASLWDDISEENAYNEIINAINPKAHFDNDTEDDFDFNETLTSFIITTSPTLSRGAVPVTIKNMALSSSVRPTETLLLNSVIDFIHDYLFGVKATSDGIIIKPHLPLTWQSCEYKRRFRGDTYDIHFNRSLPGMHSSEGLSIFVDEEPIDGFIIPLAKDHESHRVDVFL